MSRSMGGRPTAPAPRADTPAWTFPAGQREGKFVANFLGDVPDGDLDAHACIMTALHVVCNVRFAPKRRCLPPDHGTKRPPLSELRRASCERSSAPSSSSSRSSRRLTIDFAKAEPASRGVYSAGIRHFAATIANGRGPETLAALVAQAGLTITAGTREQAASKDIVFLAVNWPKLQGALEGLLPKWNGRILIDANNPMQRPPLPPIDIAGRAPSTSIVEEWAPGARVVKAFNHHLFMNLEKAPDAEGGRRVLFYAGDDAAAKAEDGRVDRAARFLRS